MGISFWVWALLYRCLGTLEVKSFCGISFYVFGQGVFNFYCGFYNFGGRSKMYGHLILGMGIFI
jgi:hypothetical protein